MTILLCIFIALLLLYMGVRSPGHSDNVKEYWCNRELYGDNYASKLLNLEDKSWQLARIVYNRDAGTWMTSITLEQQAAAKLQYEAILAEIAALEQRVKT